MTLQEQIGAELKEAMKSRNQEKLDTLRLLKSAIGYAMSEKGGADAVPTDEDVLMAVRKEVKKRDDSIEGFRRAGREEMAAKEEREKVILETFLPAALSEEQLEAIVQAAVAETGATSRKEMGAVMKIAMAKAEGRADGKTLSAKVQQALS
jgi:uncharacterized protein YqeY